MVVVGLVLIAVGGVAAGSFYIPLKQVRHWAWENYWFVNGVFSWLVMPWLIALLTVPCLIAVLTKAPFSSTAWTFVFGLLWGIGGLTFGLSMRYLGISLGYAIALGFCAAFGTITPAIYEGTFGKLLTDASGLTTLAGVVVCLVGIGFCGRAGMLKEKELPQEEKKQTVEDYSFVKGLIVAICAGAMSACMAFGFVAGESIASTAVEHGANSLWANNPVLIVIFAGGFITNGIWCVGLNLKNKTLGSYVNHQLPLVRNYLLSALAGIVWYLQFMFYGMGRPRMGQYTFASWSVLMAMIIIVSNIWGLVFREWQGCSRRTIFMITIGILIVCSSIVLIGLGNYLEAPVE